MTASKYRITIRFELEYVAADYTTTDIAQSKATLEVVEESLKLVRHSQLIDLAQAASLSMETSIASEAKRNATPTPAAIIEQNIDRLAAATIS